MSHYSNHLSYGQTFSAFPFYLVGEGEGGQLELKYGWMCGKVKDMGTLSASSEMSEMTSLEIDVEFSVAL